MAAIWSVGVARPSAEVMALPPSAITMRMNTRLGGAGHVFMGRSFLSPAGNLVNSCQELEHPLRRRAQMPQLPREGTREGCGRALESGLLGEGAAQRAGGLGVGEQ